MPSFLAFYKHCLDLFPVKDLGDLHYFLEIEVLQTPFGLLLTQHKYFLDLLEKTNMAGAKEWATPMTSTQILQLSNGSPRIDATKFRQVVGAIKPGKNSIFLKNGKTIISVENRNFSRSRMTKRTSPLNSSCEI